MLKKDSQFLVLSSHLHYLLIPLASLSGLAKQLAIVWRLNETSLGYYSLIFASSTFLAICLSSGQATFLGRRIATVNNAFRLKFSIKLLSTFSFISFLRLLVILSASLILSIFTLDYTIYLFSVVCAMPVIFSLFTVTVARFNLSSHAFSIFFFIRSFVILLIILICLFLQTPIYFILAFEFLSYLLFLPLLILFAYLDSLAIKSSLSFNQSFFPLLKITRPIILNPISCFLSFRQARSYGLSDVMTSSMAYIDKILVKQLFGIQALGLYTVLCYPITIASMTSSIFVQILQRKFYVGNLKDSKIVLNVAFVLFALLQFCINYLFFTPFLDIHPSLSYARQVPFAGIFVSLICAAFFYPVIISFLVGRRLSYPLALSSFICIFAFLITLSITYVLVPSSLNIATVLFSLASAYLFQFLFLAYTTFSLRDTAS